MVAETPWALFRRDLADGVAVIVDGVYRDLDAGEGIRQDRAVGRVLLAMPDFYAETLAHTLATAWRISNAIGQDAWVDDTEREVAEALFEAATFMGYRCPEGGLGLPERDS